ncbi:MAG: hypothetical protein M5U26_10425 [Planctomycetota bacterium]|nr:hypothetical protein [Planctomycetota bacterium]
MDIEMATDFIDRISQVSDPDFQEMAKGFLESAVHYAHIRAEWALKDAEWRLAQDQGRRIAHNAFIDRCNLMARWMEKLGLNTQWRRDLREDRKLIGDFACLLHAALGISAR